MHGLPLHGEIDGRTGSSAELWSPCVVAGDHGAALSRDSAATLGADTRTDGWTDNETFAGLKYTGTLCYQKQTVVRGTTNPAPCCHLANDTDLITPVR